LIEESLASLRPQKLFKDIDLRFLEPPDELVVTGDADQLRQVMINTLLNAAQAMQGTGELQITLTSKID
ncbi:MAG: hypothetical protein GWO08_01215, partial [Gammaproteobacteria bacterium]|nr:hypothetical protein [Gammaproteobacteria bacterium]NIR92329.1 hypothetical protein [Gammaproteobacteria bacterium]NIW46256.1 hypothetical protein [Gammaproteobacteria bacterium]